MVARFQPTSMRVGEHTIGEEQRYQEQWDKHDQYEPYHHPNRASGFFFAEAIDTQWCCWLAGSN